MVNDGYDKLLQDELVSLSISFVIYEANAEVFKTVGSLVSTWGWLQNPP